MYLIISSKKLPPVALYYFVSAAEVVTYVAVAFVNPADP